MKHIAVLRFSALGDVALCVPVVSSLAEEYPDLQITVVSRPHVQPFFDPLPPNVRFFAADLKGRHKGFFGLWRLARELRSAGVDGVADFHDVLRTKVLRLFFLLHRLPVRHINKGRKEKRQLVEKRIFHQLTPSYVRYAEVLRQMGLPLKLTFRRLRLKDFSALTTKIGHKAEGETWIGVAPFSAHDTKEYPTDKLARALWLYAEQNPSARFFIFGSPDEADRLRESWGKQFARLLFVCDRLKGFSEELQLFSRLDAMVSMDSANMHLASLFGVPVVSIWAATHPFAGFMGYGQSTTNALLPTSDCSPCSVFGNKPCPYAYRFCTEGTSPEMIAEKICTATGKEMTK